MRPKFSAKKFFEPRNSYPREQIEEGCIMAAKELKERKDEGVFSDFCVLCVLLRLNVFPLFRVVGVFRGLIGFHNQQHFHCNLSG